MRKRIIALLTTFIMLLSTVMSVQAVELGADLLNETWDNGFGTWTKEGSPTIENVKGTNAVVLDEKETVRYNPKSSELGWEDSYRATFRLKTADWAAKGNPTIMFRMKSQGNSQVYLIYYTSQGFSVTRLNPTLPAKTFISGFSGAVNADGSQWHEISVDAIRNDDKSMTLKIYFDGVKELEITDTDVTEMPVTGGVMVGNWMKDQKVYVDSVTVKPIIITKDTTKPDDPAPDTVGTSYQEDARLLRLLGIMDNYTDTLFKGDYIMTRAEFTKCVVSMMGYDDMAKTTSNKCSFSDVSSELAGYVATAEYLGIVEGCGDGLFEPDRAMSFEEAVKMLVSALGYDVGGLSYPNGYISKGAEIGLLKNVANRDTSRGTMSAMLVEALDIPLIKLEMNGSKYTYVQGETILDFLGIYTDKGIVTDDGITSYTGDSDVSQDSVRIDHVTYKSGITSANEYFGKKVKYYYKVVNDSNELLYVNPTKDNVTYTIDRDDISDDTTRQNFVYWKNNKSKKLKISSVCNFIYNGKAYPGITDSELIPNDGKVVLIDNNDDGEIDTIQIYDYKTYVVQYTAESSNTVYNLIDSSDNLVLDDTTAKIEIYRGDEPIEFDKIKSGDVIKAAISKNSKYIKLLVSSDKVSGRVDSIDSEGVVVDGVKYELSRNLAGKTLDIGSEYSFRLDYEGRIAYVENVMSKTTSYGYLRRAWYDENEENGGIEVFTAKGEWDKFEFAKKITFNNTRKESKKWYQENVFTPQLIMYTLDDNGMVKEIKTGVDNAGDNDMDYANISSAQYLYANRSFNSTYFLVDTVVFAVPENLDQTSLYRVTNCDYLRDGQKYVASVYDIDDACPKVAVVQEIDTYDTEPYVANSVMLVEEVRTSVNADNEPVTHIKGCYENKTVEYMFDSNVDGSEIAAGDIIQFTLNVDKEVINKKVIVAASNFAFKDDGGFFSTTRKVVGKVCKVYPSAKRFVFNSDGDLTLDADSIWGECVRKTPAVSVYDRTLKKAYVGSFDDLEIGDDVFVRMDREWIYDIVIYKN